MEANSSSLFRVRGERWMITGTLLGKENHGEDKEGVYVRPLNRRIARDFTAAKNWIGKSRCTLSYQIELFT